MIRINLFINFHVHVEWGDLSSNGPLGRKRGGQSERSQELDASQKVWNTAGWWPASCSLLVVAADGGRQPQCNRGSIGEPFGEDIARGGKGGG